LDLLAVHIVSKKPSILKHLMGRLTKVEGVPGAIYTLAALDKAIAVKLSSNLGVVHEGEGGLVV